MYPCVKHRQIFPYSFSQRIEVYEAFLVLFDSLPATILVDQTHGISSSLLKCGVAMAAAVLYLCLS